MIGKPLDQVRLTPDLQLAIAGASVPLTVDQAFKLAQDLLRNGSRRAVLEEALKAAPKAARASKRRG